MGIYTNDVMCGVKIAEEINEEFHVIYEKKNEERELNREEREEVMLFCEGLENKKCIYWIYVECCTSYDIEDRPFMMWDRIDRNKLYCLLKRD